MKSPLLWIVVLVVFAAPLLSSGTSLGQTMTPAPSLIPRPKIIVPVDPSLACSNPCPLDYHQVDVVTEGDPPRVKSYQCAVKDEIKLPIQAMGGCPEGWDGVPGERPDVSWRLKSYWCISTCEGCMLSLLTRPPDPLCPQNYEELYDSALQDVPGHFSCSFPKHLDTQDVDSVHCSYNCYGKTFYAEPPDPATGNIQCFSLPK